jgi:hypothetical protein
MTTKLFQLKEFIKNLSQEQKELRPQRKQNFDGIRRFKQGDAISRMRENKYNLRHYHIAYSMILGNKYEDIEKNVGEFNKPSWSRIESIIFETTGKEYSNEEIIHINAA